MKWIFSKWILDSLFSGILDSKSWILDSRAQYSRFHKQKFPGFRNPYYLTWGEKYLRLYLLSLDRDEVIHSEKQGNVSYMRHEIYTKHRLLEIQRIKRLKTNKTWNDLVESIPSPFCNVEKNPEDIPWVSAIFNMGSGRRPVPTVLVKC